jgi:hypothetical protein
MSVNVKKKLPNFVELLGKDRPLDESLTIWLLRLFQEELTRRLGAKLFRPCGTWPA